MKKYYVGMDVHKATIAIAVLDAFGKQTKLRAPKRPFKPPTLDDLINRQGD